MLENIISKYAGTPKAAANLLVAADISFDTSRTGQPVLTQNGRRLHSYVDPKREAEQLLANYMRALDEFVNTPTLCTKTIVVHSPGLGYILDSLQSALERVDSTDIQIICLEKSPEVARLAMRLHLFAEPKIPTLWLTGPEYDHDLARLTANHKIFTMKCARAESIAPIPESARENTLGTSEYPERPMRILVPTPLYGGSYPIALHCRDAFRSLGHHVEFLDLSSYYPLYASIEKITRIPHHRRVLQSLLTTYLAELISARALDWKADLVWAVAQTPLTPSALNEMRSQRIHTAFWFVEDFRLFPYWKEVCAHYDAVFTIQHGEFHDELKLQHARLVEYLPCAANPNVHHPQSLNAEELAKYGSTASFVGAGYPNRQAAFSKLNLDDLKIWGNDWPRESTARKWVQEDGRRVSTEETAKIFCASNINLNLHSSMNTITSPTTGDFVNPRTFEIAACGGFQIVNRRTELSECFQEGEEIVVFDSIEQIPSLIALYGENEPARQKIADRARERVLAQAYV